MKELKKLKGFWKIIFILVAIYVGLGGIMFSYYQSGNGTKEAAGQFGDMFGGITALFGTLTFAGVLYTIILQRKELMLTRKEMKLSRLAFEEQNTTTKIQRFENTFFKMIESIENAKENIKVVYDNGFTVNGDKAFDQIYQSTKDALLIHSDRIKYTGKNITELNAFYFGSQRKLNSNISVYYSRVNNLIELVSKSELPFDQKNFFIRILNTSISNRHELALLYYHFSFSNDYITEESKEFIKKSQLFDNLIYGDLIHPSHVEILTSDEYIKIYKEIITVTGRKR